MIPVHQLQLDGRKHVCESCALEVVGREEACSLEVQKPELSVTVLQEVWLLASRCILGAQRGQEPVHVGPLEARGAVLLLAMLQLQGVLPPAARPLPQGIPKQRLRITVFLVKEEEACRGRRSELWRGPVPSAFVSAQQKRRGLRPDGTHRRCGRLPAFW